MSWKKIFYAGIMILVAAIAALGGSVVGGIAVYSALQDQQPSAEPTPVFVEAPPTLNSEQPVEIVVTEMDTAITHAVEKIGPAVVTVVGLVPGQNTFFGRTPDQPVSGSGVIISEDGYVITNNHVIEDTIEVGIILADGTEIPAEIVGTDIFSDLAVLKVNQPVPAVANLGNSDALKPGETVIAIGSPLGDFKNTVTAGVVSATERMIDINENYQMEGLIQTDAAINQGNSGGPLVNLAGEVIGINTLIVRGGNYGSAIAEGLGFAIPSNKTKAITNQLIENGYVAYPYLGIRWQWLTPQIIRAYNLPVEGGVYVARIDPNSPAEQAGLQQGDIITHMGDQVLDDAHPYINVLYAYSPGDTSTLDIVRSGEQLQLSVTFGEHPSP
jgi:2-alkenal reductase